MKVSQKPLRVPIRPPASDEYDSFLREYISSPPDVRLDLIQSTRAVDGFLVLLNSSVHTLCHIRVDRQKDGSKELTGVTGNSQQYYVFRVDAKVAVQNFGASTTLNPDDEELPEGVDSGRPLRRIISKQKKPAEIKKQLLEDLFDGGSLPEDEDQDVLPFFLPVAFPIFSYHQSFSGETEEKATYNSLFSVHPILGLWVEATSRVLHEGFSTSKLWKLVAPQGHGNSIAASPNMPVKITMHGEVYHHYVEVVARLTMDASSSSSSSDDESDSSDDEAWRGKYAKKVTKKPPSKKRKHVPTDDESEDEGKKFEPFLHMLDVLLAVPTLNAADELLELDAPHLTADLTEFVRTASSNKVLSRMLTNALHARVNGRDGNSRDYILHSADLPVIGQATTTYLLSSQFASPRSSSIEALKNSFNIFSLTPPPLKSKAYDEHLRDCSRNHADDILEQPDHLSSAIKRHAFLGGRQETLSDVLATIGNLFMFFRCFVDFDISNENTYPLFLRRISSIAAVISDHRFRNLVSTATAPWIPHQLLQFIQTYFESLTLNATNPAIIRNLLTERGPQRLPVHHFRDSEYLFRSFNDHLRQAMVTCNIGFFHSPPQSYYSFFPNAKVTPLPPQQQKQEHRQEHRPRQDHSGPPPQLIVVGTGSTIPPHSKLSVRPCSDFLLGKCTKASSGIGKCTFAHLLFPRDFERPDRIVMERWVEDAPHLQWASGAKSALDRLKEKASK